jgi:hypothetical protein
MAKFYHKLAYVSIGGVDLSDHIANFEINETRAELTTTAFGDHDVRRISDRRHGWFQLCAGWHRDLCR